MTPLTLYLARLLGLFAAIAGLAMLLHKERMLAAINELARNRPVSLILAFLNLLGGLAIVIGHNVWSGGLLSIVVTLIGWWILVRAMLMLFLPDGTTGFLQLMRFERLYYFYGSISLAIGIYLSIAGFTG